MLDHSEESSEERYQNRRNEGFRLNNLAVYGGVDPEVDANEVWHEAFNIATDLEDPTKQVTTLGPWARYHWLNGDFEQARERLEQAEELLQGSVDLLDEAGAVQTLFGRLAAVRSVRDGANTKRELVDDSLPRFVRAYEMLKGDDHRYYPYANASHGSIVALVAGYKGVARTLVKEGRSIAGIPSAEEHDSGKKPRNINERDNQRLIIARVAVATFPVVEPLVRRNSPLIINNLVR